VNDRFPWVKSQVLTTCTIVCSVLGRPSWRIYHHGVETTTVVRHDENTCLGTWPILLHLTNVLTDQWEIVIDPIFIKPSSYFQQFSSTLLLSSRRHNGTVRSRWGQKRKISQSAKGRGGSEMRDRSSLGQAAGEHQARRRAWVGIGRPGLTPFRPIGALRRCDVTGVGGATRGRGRWTSSKEPLLVRGRRPLDAQNFATDLELTLQV
jgi:hypothetical protein